MNEQIFQISYAAIGALLVIIGFVCGGLALFIRLSISSALSGFENRLVDRLNGKYVSDRLCRERVARLEALESGQAELSEYSHKWKHAYNGWFHVLLNVLQRVCDKSPDPELRSIRIALRAPED